MKDIINTQQPISSPSGRPGGALYIIKIGGNIIDDERDLLSFLEEFAAIDGYKILVHGGGKLATHLAERLNIPQQVVEGRRITDAETLKIVTMVYAGYINKNIVAKLQSFNCNALGLCGADGDAILAHKRKHPVMDYGFVGDVDAINIGMIDNLIRNNITPIFAPITHDQQGQLLNTNADTIAQELAKALSHVFEVTLIYLFEKSGVLLDINDDKSVIPVINQVSYKEMKAAEKIFAGMIPKLDNAFEALNSGIKKVILGKAGKIKDILKGNSGTIITNE
ncbi:MAG: acetylglutamate kinase [Chitinophagaceae bacterium]